MTKLTNITNSASMVGRVNSDLVLSHSVYGEKFYVFHIQIQRLSDSYDILPITISERILATQPLKKGDIVEIQGQLRSYNNYTSEGNKLILTIFAKNIKILTDIIEIKNPNNIILNGYICKTPVFRTTPFGREITDILIAVNRPYNKSDYIPCICWGRNARFSETLRVGDNIQIYGRLQSRDYQKKNNMGELIQKTAYEVSISKLEICTNKENPAEIMDEG